MAARWLRFPGDGVFLGKATGEAPLKLDAHERTRKDHASEVAEDYAEAIADIVAEKGICRLSDLASHFSVTPATANNTVARLVRDGLASTARYQPIDLTAKGKLLAAKCKKRHELVHSFLLWLGVSDETAAADSEGIEHHVSQETLDAMQQALDKSQAGQP